MAAHYTFEDLSGGSNSVTSDNPYQDLIAACHNEPSQIQSRYHNHRTIRNYQQRTKLLAPEFPGVTVDDILAKLEDRSNNGVYEDPRNCLVLWARPTKSVKSLITQVQQRLLGVAPKLWIMPQDSLHMTAMEVTHSLTAPEIDDLVAEVLQHDIQSITDYTFIHRTRLIKPVVSFDAQALALSFLPAEEDAYTYHHLRRDLYDKIQACGVKVASRYVTPSAHLTIGRFITKTDFETADGTVDTRKVARLVSTIEEINDWLQADYWPRGGQVKAGGEWTVGQEKGLECRKGTLWYGGGERVHLGTGF